VLCSKVFYEYHVISVAVSSVPCNFCCSIISTHNGCCTSIVDYENSFKIFVRLFQKYPGRQDIVVRLGYALGNLMANSDTARTKVRMCLYYCIKCLSVHVSSIPSMCAFAGFKVFTVLLLMIQFFWHVTL
jgi:hypothetical protein